MYNLGLWWEELKGEKASIIGQSSYLVSDFVHDKDQRKLSMAAWNYTVRQVMQMKYKISISDFSSANYTMKLHGLSIYGVKNISLYPKVMQDSDIIAWGYPCLN